MKILLCVVNLVAALGIVGSASALTLDDFLPPAAGGTVDPQQSVSQSDDVIQAETMQDAMGYAYQQLMNNDGAGVLTVKTKTGMGMLSTSTKTYQVYDNLNATLLSKRSAYTQAFISAQGQLVQSMNGFSSACEQQVSNNLSVFDTGVESNANSNKSSSEICREVTEGVLAGFVTYKVDDNADDMSVSVTIASSTKTRGVVGRAGGAVVVSADPSVAFEHIAREISIGVVPPVGAKLIYNPINNESIVIGFGSAIIRKNRDVNMQRQMRTLANRQSEARANNALIAFLNNSEVYWQGGFDEQQVESSEQFELPLGENNEALDPVAFDQTRNQFLSLVSQTDSYSVVTQGQVPAGVQTRSFPSEDGYWMNTIAIYMPSVTAQAQQAAAENRNAVNASSEGQSGRRINMQGGLNSGAENPQGPSGRVVRDNDF